MADTKKKKLGLVPKLIIAIIIGVTVGVFGAKLTGSSANAFHLFVRITDTFRHFFASFLNFIIPFMVLGFVVSGISDLGQGAGKLLGITAGISYFSTILAGTLSYFMATTIFPNFITVSTTEVQAVEITPLFSIGLIPMFDVLGAIFLAFILGLGISVIRNKDRARDTLHKAFSEFSDIISMVLSGVVIPLLPLYIGCNFINMAYSGEVFPIIGLFIRVFGCVLALHILYLLVMFAITSLYTGKSFTMMVKNQIPPYLTAIGTQSSAVTIPVNVEAARKNGVSKGIREFVIPLCATIHLAGSIITIASCVTAVLMMNGLDYSFKTFFPFLLILGVAMVAAPGTPGGAIMSALPFMNMVGIAVGGPMADLLITLYITQDSFGTAVNVSGDNAIAAIVDKIHDGMIARGTASRSEEDDEDHPVLES